MIGAATRRQHAQPSSYPSFVPPAPSTRFIQQTNPLLFASGSDGEFASRVLDRLELEIVVVDATGAIAFFNDPGRRLLSANKGVFSQRGNLFFEGCENNRWLRSALTSLVQDRGHACVTFIPSDDPAETRCVSIHLLRNDLKEASHFLVTFSRSAVDPSEEVIRQLMQHFGLTPAEQRLTVFLSAGGHLMDAARTFRVSRHTVRNQLKSIFEKVGVKRQAELTRLMCVGPRICGLA